ncbi:MAG: metallophosphoesterase [Armatimonadota bacterium]|nr:metallophosphoesterase [Armatimonadota bacterium]
MRIAVFLAVVLSVTLGLHYFFWARLVRDTALPAPYRQWATALVVSLGVSLPLAMFLGRVLPPAWRGPLAWPVFVWMGVMFLLFVTLLGAELVRLGLSGWARLTGEGPLDPARRTFFARLLGGAAGATAGTLGAYSVYQAIAALHVREVEVKLDRLPEASRGTTIVQLTDVHLGATLGRAFCQAIVDKVNALAPDVVAITGDLVDGTVEQLREAAAPLARLRARHGVYFVTGNHEYYSGVGPWMEELARLGIRVLRNERVAIEPHGPGASEGSPPQGGFDLAGVDDYTAFGDGHRADLPRALAGRDPARPVVLLAHQPRQVREAAALGVDLQISGHTHAGQIWPFKYLVRLVQPFVAGLGRLHHTQIYVSAGTGYWGPPLRLGTQAEITRITLA